MIRRRAMGTAILGLAGVVGMAITGLVLVSWRRPLLGPVDGRLRPCPDSPNCVSSFATDDKHRLVPFPANDGTMQQLRNLLAKMPNVSIIVEHGQYLHAECATPVFRFVDDLEFLYRPEEGVIHVRSASRAGRSDFGTNRARVEEIRRQLAESAEDRSR